MLSRFARGGVKVIEAHEATDHGWSDHRIALEARIIDGSSRLE